MSTPSLLSSVAPTVSSNALGFNSQSVRLSRRRAYKRPEARKKSRKSPHCRTCGFPMRGHDKHGCPKTKHATKQIYKLRQYHILQLAHKYRGMVHAALVPTKAIGLEIEEAEKLGLKTRVAQLTKSLINEEEVLLLLGEDGRAVHDLGNILVKEAVQARQGGHWRVFALWLWKTVVATSEKPWVHKIAENAILGWIGVRGRSQRCKQE